MLSAVVKCQGLEIVFRIQECYKRIVTYGLEVTAWLTKKPIVLCKLAFQSFELLVS